jgi:DNA polymerase-1
MIKVDQLIKARGWEKQIFLLLQVHDELVYEVAEALVAEAQPLIRQAMESVQVEGIPFTATAAVGQNWSEAKA